MTTARIQADPALAGLMLEVHRYLAAVDTFRAEGREPRWSPERRPDADRARVRGHARSVHRER